MPLLPVADVLLIEKRTCRCGAVSRSASPHRYRLYKACQGEPDKTVIRALKEFPEKESEMEDLSPLPSRVIRELEIPALFCEHCWEPTMALVDALAFRPPTPITSLTTTMSAAWTKAQSAATGKTPKVRALAIEEL